MFANSLSVSQILILFVLALTMVGILTPWMRRVALKLNIVDIPNTAHKSHSEAIPYLGGVSIILGILSVVYGAILSQENMQNFFWTATALYLPALFLGIVGLIDDYKALDPLPRFIAQSVAGIFTAAFLIVTNTMGNPSGNLVLDGIITAVWIVGISNAINFFDNLDGGAAGAVAIAALGTFFISQSLGQFLISASAITIFGALLGFLIWNKSPAKIFMGDAGALFLGILISSLTVRLDPDSESKLTSFAIPLMLLAVPILDTTVAVFSRVRRGKSIFRGGQDHLSHRLLRTGLTKRQTAYTLWSLAGVFAFIATTISIREQNSHFLVYLASIVWLLLLLAFLKSSDE